MGEYVPGLLWLFVLLVSTRSSSAPSSPSSRRGVRRSSPSPRRARAARTALYAMEHATLMLATSQLGITSARC